MGLVARLFFIASAFLFFLFVSPLANQQFASASCPSALKPLTITPLCHYSGTTSDRVHVIWNAIPGATSYSLRWWFTDKTSSGTSTYNECYLHDWFSGTSADMDTQLNTATKYAHIRQLGWHCWPSSLSATKSGIGFAVYGNNSTCEIYQSTIANTACITGGGGGGGSGNTAPLTLVVGLPGIGFDATGSVSPKHNTRTVSVELYGANVVNPSGPGTAPLSTTTGIVTYDNGSDNNAGYFVGSISVNLPTTATLNNQYQVLVKMPQYLNQLAVNATPANTTLPTVFTLTSGTHATTAPFKLFAGDVAITAGGNNKLTIDDYNQVQTCFASSADSTCTKTSDGILYADLDDNGIVDIVDFNIWLRSLFALQQIQPSVCTDGACQGD